MQNMHFRGLMNSFHKYYDSICSRGLDIKVSLCKSHTHLHKDHDMWHNLNHSRYCLTSRHSNFHKSNTNFELGQNKQRMTSYSRPSTMVCKSIQPCNFHSQSLTVLNMSHIHQSNSDCCRIYGYLYHKSSIMFQVALNSSNKNHGSKYCQEFLVLKGLGMIHTKFL